MAYLGKFFWPVRLAVFYPLPPEGSPIWIVVAACGILVGITAAVFVVRRSHPYLLVGWLWYLGMLVPVIGIVQVGSQAMADRYTYLPQIGLCIALVWYGAEFVGGKSSRRWLCYLVAGSVLAALMGTAWRQTTHWHDSEALWNQAAASTSGNFVAYYNLGVGKQRDGQIDAAIARYQKTLEINPNYADAHNNLGAVRAGLGQIDAAIVHFRKATEINPENAEFHFNYASALAGVGQTKEAAAQYEMVLAIDPNNTRAHNNLGAVQMARGRIDVAIIHFRRALEINPNNRASPL